MAASNVFAPARPPARRRSCRFVVVDGHRRRRRRRRRSRRTQNKRVAANARAMAANESFSFARKRARSENEAQGRSNAPSRNEFLSVAYAPFFARWFVFSVIEKNLIFERVKQQSVFIVLFVRRPILIGI